MSNYYDKDQVEAKSQREWNANSAIRAEFCDDYGIFLAFKKAEAKGTMKIHGCKVIQGGK